MELTIEEYQNLVKSRFAELKAAIQEYEVDEPLVDDDTNLERLKKVSGLAENLYYAYNAKVDAEMEQLAAES